MKGLIVINPDPAGRRKSDSTDAKEQDQQATLSASAGFARLKVEYPSGQFPGTLATMGANTMPSHAADVIIIGGGVIGCSIAFRLAQAHLSVLVIDRGEPGAEASAAAAGMLAPQGETVQPDAFFEFCYASKNLYPSFLAEIQELSRLNVAYRLDGTLLVALDEEESRDLDEIFRGQTRAGLELERLTPEAVHSQAPGLSPRIRSALFVPGDHWVDNEQLMQAVVEAGRRLGVRFLNRSAVTKLNVWNGRVESVEAGGESTGASLTLSGGQIIIAAGCWSSELAAPLGIPLRMEPCRGQMIEFDSPTDLLFMVRAGRHYLVPRSGRRILLGTTAEYVGFDNVVTGEGLRSILEGTARIAPLVKDLRFRRAWAGLRPDTADHLPILGYGELKNLIFATGHFRNGILLAPLTAQLISELLLTGSTSRPIDAYRPTRFAP